MKDKYCDVMSQRTLIVQGSLTSIQDPEKHVSSKAHTAPKYLLLGRQTHLTLLILCTKKLYWSSRLNNSALFGSSPVKKLERTGEKHYHNRKTEL